MVLHFESMTGKGIKGEVEGHVVLLGNARFLEDAGVDFAQLKAEAESLRQEGQTVMLVAIDGEAAGLLGSCRSDQTKYAGSRATTSQRGH